MKQLADRYRTAATVLAIIALRLMGRAAVTGRQQLAGWSPVITTVIATIAAYRAVHRYDALALEYARTVQQLELLKVNRAAAASHGNSHTADDDFVASAKSVISMQNESWMARNVAIVRDGGEDSGAPQS